MFINHNISTPIVQVRRTKVATIWDKSNSNVSMTKLLAVAAGYIANDAARREGLIAKAKTTYLDEDGDEVNVSLDDELKDAFLQVLTVLPLRKALIVNVKFPKAIEVQTKRIQIKTIEPSNKANMADLAACLKKFQESHDSGTASKVVNDPQGGRVEPIKNTVSESPIARGKKKMNINLRINPQDFNDEFLVHAHHTCNGCSATPIVGTRYHATKVPNFDLCASCFTKYDGDDIGLTPEIQGKCAYSHAAVSLSSFFYYIRSSLTLAIVSSCHDSARSSYAPEVVPKPSSFGKGSDYYHGRSSCVLEEVPGLSRVKIYPECPSWES